MARSSLRPSTATLFVEGGDDCHTVIQLLQAHGLDFGDPSGLSLPRIQIANGVDKVLAAMEPAIRLSIGGSIGFVLDVDDDLVSRWQSVLERLRRAGITPPPMPETSHLLIEPAATHGRIGIWLMPGLGRTGALEEFLRDLIPVEDTLINFAEEATRASRAAGARFSDSAELKAVLRAWLAWQHEPGKPYGQALKAGYFGHTSPAAQAFLDWFRGLYGLPTG